MFRVSPERTISITDLPTRLSEILNTSNDDNIWLITEGETPKLAVVNAEFFDQLLRRAWFDELATQTHSAFRDYLLRRGPAPETLSEQEIERILQAGE